jgi:uncharacterized protein with HEPN domain
MRERRPKWLFDALGAIDAAAGFLGGVDLAEYQASLLLRSAVERQLEILGEACSRLAREDPQLPMRIPACRLATGLRNRVIHGYDAIDDETVYRTVLHDLPALRSALAEELARIESAPARD